MKVKLIKIHNAWNELYPNEFQVGDIVELNGKLVQTKNGRIFLADDLCLCFGNSCSYSDIFDKDISLQDETSKEN